MRGGFYIDNIVDRLKKQVDEYNMNAKNDIRYQLYIGSEHFNIGLEDRSCFDYRLFQEQYIHRAISLLVYSVSSNREVGHATFYILPKEISQEIYFWSYIPTEKKLLKSYLCDLESYKEEEILFIAFGLIHSYVTDSNLVYEKAMGMKMYMQLLNLVMDEFYVLGEPTGVYELNMDLNQQTSLSEKDVGTFANLGKVTEESMPVYHLVNFLKMTEIPDLYHHITLGPIYYKTKNRNLAYDI